MPYQLHCSATHWPPEEELEEDELELEELELDELVELLEEDVLLDDELLLDEELGFCERLILRLVMSGRELPFAQKPKPTADIPLIRVFQASGFATFELSVAFQTFVTVLPCGSRVRLQLSTGFKAWFSSLTSAQNPVPQEFCCTIVASTPSVVSA